MGLTLDAAVGSVPMEGNLILDSVEFIDADVESGKTYYYYIDAIGMNGRKERFSPTLSKTITD